MKLKKLASSLLIMVMATGVLTGCSSSKGEDLGNNGVPDGEITIYTALEEEFMDPYLKTFREQYPDVELNIVRASTGDITARLLAEKDNPQADVVWGTAATSLLTLNTVGALEAYAPEGLDKVDPAFKDSAAEPTWVGINAWMTGITVNTEELEKLGLEIPQSYEDLLKPEYKGLVTMPNPASSGTGYLTVSGLMQLMGEDTAWEYMDKLHENIAEYTHSGSAPSKLAASGEFPIGIGMGYKGLAMKQEGYPVDVIFPKEGSGWDLEANALVKKDNIKEESKLFLDWAISEDAMQEYGKNYAVTSVEIDNEIPEGYPEKPLEQMIDNDLEWAANNRESILEQWITKYDGKSQPK